MNSTIKEFNTAIKLLDNARLAYENYFELREKALEYISEHTTDRLDQIPSKVTYGPNGEIMSVLAYDLNEYMECNDYMLENSTKLKYSIKDAMHVVEGM